MRPNLSISWKTSGASRWSPTRTSRKGALSFAEGNLWSAAEVGETHVINFVAECGFAAAPMGASVEGQAEPAIEVISGTAAQAPRIGFQWTAHW
jgi:hypothetical protein